MEEGNFSNRFYNVISDRLAVSTALVMFHRFYACQSFKQHNRFVRVFLTVDIATHIHVTVKWRSLHKYVSNIFNATTDYLCCLPFSGVKGGGVPEEDKGLGPSIS